MVEGQASEGGQDLHGLRVMIVEDDYLMASAEESWLLELGCEVVGPLPTVSDALALLASDLPDGAVLDIELCGDKVYPVARLLAQHNIPFLFVSGCDPDRIDENFRSVPRLMKPFSESQLRRAACRGFSPRDSRCH